MYNPLYSGYAQIFIKIKIDFPLRYPIFKYLCIEYEICNMSKSHMILKIENIKI